MTRQEAKALGLITYNTGRPCKHGHYADRYVKTHACVECNKHACYEFRKKNPNKYSEYQKSYQKFYQDSYSNSSTGREVRRKAAAKYCRKNRLYYRWYNSEHSKLKKDPTYKIKPFEPVPETRSAAVKAKSKYYFTNTPCINGHYSLRRTTTYKCVECEKLKSIKNKEASKTYRQKNVESINEYRKKNAARLREYQRQYQREYRKKNAARLREYARLRYKKMKNDCTD